MANVVPKDMLSEVVDFMGGDNLRWDKPTSDFRFTWDTCIINVYDENESMYRLVCTRATERDRFAESLKIALNLVFMEIKEKALKTRDE